MISFQHGYIQHMKIFFTIWIMKLKMNNGSVQRMCVHGSSKEEKSDSYPELSRVLAFGIANVQRSGDKRQNVQSLLLLIVWFCEMGLI